MDVRQALKTQYRAALAMLRDCVEKCPEAVWISGEHPRNFWRIAYHGVFYAHLYLMQNEEAFQPWEKTREDCSDLWEDANAPVREPYTRQEILDYIGMVDAMVEPVVDALDLDTEDSGFYWYKNITKLEHEMLSIRHLQGHVGQLSELLMAQGIDTDWVSQVPRRS